MLLKARNKATESRQILVLGGTMSARVSYPPAGLTCRRHLRLGSPPQVGLPCTSHILAHSFEDMGGRENKDTDHTPSCQQALGAMFCFSPQAGL